MPKTSTINSRLTPPADSSASAGRMLVRADTIAIESAERLQLIDVTDRLIAFIGTAGVRDGLLSVWSMHTTCAVFINEAQRALHADILRFLEQSVSRDGGWLHNDPAHSDCDRMNADSHLRAMLLGHGVTLQIAGGEPVLGQWQRVIVAELDGPRTRTLRLQAMGIGQG